VFFLCLPTAVAFGSGRRVPLTLKPGDVLPTGNEWIPNRNSRPSRLAGFAAEDQWQ